MLNRMLEEISWSEKIMHKSLKILRTIFLFPVITFLWMIGWTLTFLGLKQPRKENPSSFYKKAKEKEIINEKGVV